MASSLPARVALWDSLLKNEDEARLTSTSNVTTRLKFQIISLDARELQEYNRWVQREEFLRRKAKVCTVQN